MPVISPEYAGLLHQAPDALKRAAIKHEADWRSIYRQMEILMGVGP